MRLSDVMGALQLTAYAEAGLVLFLAAFAAIVFRLWRDGDSEQWRRARFLPLEGSAKKPDQAAPHPSRSPAKSASAKRP